MRSARPLVRPVVCLALTASLAGAGVAGAAVKRAAPKPKPVCNLVTDPSGDANGFVLTGTPLPSDDYLDILSADIASDAKNLTAAIRLKAVGADSTAPTGSTLYFNFTAGDTKLFVDAVLDGKGGATYAFGDFSGKTGGRNTLGSGTGVVDAAKKEIRITAPVNGFSASLKPGTKISGLDVLAQRFFGTAATGGVTPTADEAQSSKTYTAGAPSCVKPGQ